MIDIILYIVIVLCFIGVGIIFLRKIPVVSELSDEEIIILTNKKGTIHKVREINVRKHFLNVLVVLEKFLRRLKIVFLKIENLLSRWIQGLGKHSKTMTHKSREWIKHREAKKIEKKNGRMKIDGIVRVENLSMAEKIEKKKKEEKIEEKEDVEILEPSPIKGSISIAELEKPTKEEQKWINLIIENPKNITAYKFLGILYWKQHNYSDARASLEMAVKLGSRDRKVKEILEEIKQDESENEITEI